MRSVLFICTANICRSPMAEGVLRKVLADHGVTLEIDSAGTHAYHAGRPTFPLAVESAKRRGYALDARSARRIRPFDFEHFDLILAMDRSNVASLNALAPTACRHKVERLLDYGDKYHDEDVPDPFGGSPEDFDRALEMIEDGCSGLAATLMRAAYPGNGLRLE